MTPLTLLHKFCHFLAVQKQRSPHTVSSYRNDIDQFFNILKHQDILSITDTHIHSYLQHLNDCKLSQRSIHRKISALDQFWRYLIQEGMAQFNPWVSIRRPKIKQHLPVYLEEHAMIELLDNYPSSSQPFIRNKAILELLFSSGIRVNELTTLTLDRIDLHAQECRVFGKGDKERIVLFGSRARLAIQAYTDHVWHDWATPKTRHLFISKQAQPLTTRTIQRIVKDANQYHSSTVEITPHSCRHTCASMLMSNGAGIRDIQELLGHSSITTTERYSHLPTKKLRERFLDVMSE